MYRWFTGSRRGSIERDEFISSVLISVFTITTCHWCVIELRGSARFTHNRRHFLSESNIYSRDLMSTGKSSASRSKTATLTNRNSMTNTPKTIKGKSGKSVTGDGHGTVTKETASNDVAMVTSPDHSSARVPEDPLSLLTSLMTSIHSTYRSNCNHSNMVSLTRNNTLRLP